MVSKGTKVLKVFIGHRVSRDRVAYWQLNCLCFPVRGPVLELHNGRARFVAWLKLQLEGEG
jgi:hypothetical protein